MIRNVSDIVDGLKNKIKSLNKMYKIIVLRNIILHNYLIRINAKKYSAIYTKQIIYLQTNQIYICDGALVKPYS